MKQVVFQLDFPERALPEQEQKLVKLLKCLLKRWAGRYRLIFLFRSSDTKPISRLRREIVSSGNSQRLRWHAYEGGGKYGEELDSYTLESLRPTHLFALFYDEIRGRWSWNRRFFSVSFPRPESRPKLAYFSPLPPQKSGIAFYSTELLPLLSKFYDLTLVVPNEAFDEVLEEHCCDFPMIRVEDFLSSPETFSRRIYHIGNSRYHLHMWELLRRYPGVVVLHDFYLSAALAYSELVLGSRSWSQELFDSHGFKPLRDLHLQDAIDEVKFTYPCNFNPLLHARSLVVHSGYAKKLLTQWYRVVDEDVVHSVPLMAPIVSETDRVKAKKSLGFAPSDLLICSFGILNKTKLNHRLLDAFLQSSLAQDPKVHLLFVGENDSGAYAIELEKEIRSSSCPSRIHITGWIEEKRFRTYLQAADIAVQLRALSRGESSRTVLDCLSYALPVVLNANGSMSEFPDDCVWKLADDFEDEELLVALETLGRDRQRRVSLGERGRIYVRQRHDPKHCASLYRNAIESSYRSSLPYRKLLGRLAATPRREREPLAQALALSTPLWLRQRQILVDLSALVQEDLGSGIQRVAKSQLACLLELLPPSWRLEPVALQPTPEGWRYRYARDFMCDFLDLPFSIGSTEVVFGEGDILYIPDLYPTGTAAAHDAGVYDQIIARGVRIETLLHDILPLTHSHCFPPGADEPFRVWLQSVTAFSDRVIAISQATRDAYETWCTEEKLRCPLTAVLHHGADFTEVEKSWGPDTQEKSIPEELERKPFFLMVGTIEPRKGYLPIIDAFDRLWSQGEEVSLVIVGKEGWKGQPESQRRNIPQTVQILRHHPETGKRLFWYEGITDEVLAEIYRNALALIAASEAEGFGLPLVEAAAYGTPVIARKIPIFEEIGGEQIFYLPSAPDVNADADAIEKWLLLHRSGQVLEWTLPLRTWRENVTELLEIWGLSPGE